MAPSLAVSATAAQVLLRSEVKVASIIGNSPNSRFLRTDRPSTSTSRDVDGVERILLQQP